MKRTRTATALYQVREGWGYTVVIVDETGRIVEEYSAGDSPNDSQVYATGIIKGKTLRQGARRTAQGMLDEYEARGWRTGGRHPDEELLEDAV